MRVILFDPNYGVNYDQALKAQSTEHWSHKGRWLVFEDLVDVFEVTAIDQVVPILEAIETQVLEHGYYAAGWISYEASPAFDSALKTRTLSSFPLVKFGLFKQCRAQTSGELFAKGIASKESCVNGHDGHDGQQSLTNWQLNTDADDYRDAIEKIKWQISQGNTYQVNFTLRQYADYVGSPWDLFEKMSSQARYGAFIEDDEYVICSASPELFFKKQNNALYAKPMKGTSHRGMTLANDTQLRQSLRQSSKNQAENLMIVDMIRNDLSKVADKGSVQVPNLFHVEKYPTVWQMTSTVKATTQSSMVDILKALFPCASITGAPKVNTMKIIGALESSPRKVYCGAMGYFSRNELGSCDAQFSVPIRTLLINKQYSQAEYGVGSGIVWDSNADDEFQECLTKSKVLKDDFNPSNFYLFETILWSVDDTAHIDELENDYRILDTFYLLNFHLSRIQQSAEYFDFPLDKNKMYQALEKTALQLIDTANVSNNERCQCRVKLMLDHQGNVEISSAPFQPSLGNSVMIKNVKLQKHSVRRSDRWLYHKTSNRSVYEQYQSKYQDYDDVLLCNEEGNITESCIANFFYKISGSNQLFTPPVSDGLLAGTYRQMMIDEGNVLERSISFNDIDIIEKAYLANSLRKIYSINIVC